MLVLLSLLHPYLNPPDYSSFSPYSATFNGHGSYRAELKMSQYVNPSPSCTCTDQRSGRGQVRKVFLSEAGLCSTWSLPLCQQEATFPLESAFWSHYVPFLLISLYIFCKLAHSVYPDIFINPFNLNMYTFPFLMKM